MVAEADEAGDLVRRVDVDLPARDRAVVGDEADHVAAEPAERGDHVARALGLQLEVVAVVADLLIRIVTSSGVFKPVGELNALRSRMSISVVERSIGVAGRAERRAHAVVVRQVREQPQRRAQRSRPRRRS